MDFSSDSLSWKLVTFTQGLRSIELKWPQQTRSQTRRCDISSSTYSGENLQKNLQKDALKVQLEAYRAKLLLLQQEVALICDKTDRIELLRAQELEEASQTRHHLEAKLIRYKSYVKDLEVERDDLRDSVMELVAKGESPSTFHILTTDSGLAVESNSNLLNVWPRSRLEMNALLGKP